MKTKSRILNKVAESLIVACLTSTLPVYGQSDTYPCDTDPIHTDSRLTELFSQKKISEDTDIEILDMSGAMSGAISTSILIPESGQPGFPEHAPADYILEYDYEYQEWSCKYSSGKALDGNPKTAWVEGVKGHGIGEILLVKVDLKGKVKIWSGYGKSERLHKENSRPKKLRVAVIQYQFIGVAQVSWRMNGLKIISENIVELEDVNGFQNLPIKEFSVEEDENYLLGLQILEVYKGTKYQDTAISEVQSEEDASKRSSVPASKDGEQVQGEVEQVQEEREEVQGQDEQAKEISSSQWIIWALFTLAGFVLLLIFLQLRRSKK